MRRVVTLLLIVLALASLGMRIQPQTHTVEGGVGAEYETIFTVTNTGGTPSTLQLVPSRFSEYLANSADLSETNFLLEPQQSKNIQVIGQVPVLGPEEHELQYELRREQEVLGRYTIRIPIAGTPSLEPRIRIDVPEIAEDDALTTYVTLLNFGNVIAYYNLSLRIEQESVEIGSIQYPQLEQVLPGEEKDVILLFTQPLDAGEYVVFLQAEVNGEETLTERIPLRVQLAQEERRIVQGEDIIISLTGTGSTQTVEYELVQGSNIVIRDTVAGRTDEIIIPSATLSPGRYTLTTIVTHDQGTDRNIQTVIIEQKSNLSWPVVIGVLLAGIVGAMFRKTLTIHYKIWLLSMRIARREKQLNRLIQEAHSL